MMTTKTTITAYVRSSNLKLDLDRQRRGIRKWAKLNGYTVIVWHEQTRNLSAESGSTDKDDDAL